VPVTESDVAKLRAKSNTTATYSKTKTTSNQVGEGGDVVAQNATEHRVDLKVGKKNAGVVRAMEDSDTPNRWRVVESERGEAAPAGAHIVRDKGYSRLFSEAQSQATADKPITVVSDKILSPEAVSTWKGLKKIYPDTQIGEDGRYSLTFKGKAKPTPKIDTTPDWRGGIIGKPVQPAQTFLSGRQAQINAPQDITGEWEAASKH
jgi:hypothetical protein